MDNEKKKDVEKKSESIQQIAKTKKSNISETKEHADVRVEAIQQNVQSSTTANNDIDASKKENSENLDASNGKKKKIILFSVIGAVVLVLAIIIGIIIANAGKPSKKEAEKIVKSYISAFNDADGDKMIDIIDAEGMIIFQEEGEKKFNKKYKDKKKYVKNWIEDKDLDDIEDVEDKLKDSFESTNSSGRYEASLKEIVSVKKSEKSSKLAVIKAKIKMKTESYYSEDSSETKTIKFYVLKVKGKYKIVGTDFAS